MARRKFSPIGEQLEKSFEKVHIACVIADELVTRNGGKNPEFSDNLEKILWLLKYCDDNKMYSVRDRAIEKILHNYL